MRTIQAMFIAALFWTAVIVNAQDVRIRITYEGVVTNWNYNANQSARITNSLSSADAVLAAAKEGIRDRVIAKDDSKDRQQANADAEARRTARTPLD